ncbi:hypothetical protein [Clostridium cellulovorans]|uniref:CRISPR-associated protein Cas5 n=1 Tax=Clostridium cellulovorans (strain ATCC 35296 / DSM 3052 / OCM 3 / 743B) TaxID=573061 RepID=D9SP80_CLOC7|nr:hypothetical protein [Clostridium cellulovorans]ADL52045.1 hypothetical protein Clocel_2326 [Clostridium cellulovorans 743B]
MNKITYKTANLFTLKKYENSNLNCQSYEYPTLYAIRSAILGAIIQVDGVMKAEELFHKVKNAVIYIQYPKVFHINGCKIKRYANSYYGINNEQKLDRENLIKNNFYTTMGFREYIDVEDIVFYIDMSIPNINLYLKNIDWIGTAESLVYLHSIEEVQTLNNVMVPVPSNEVRGRYNQFDWDSKARFEHIYLYSDKYTHKHRNLSCSIKDLVL